MSGQSTALGRFFKWLVVPAIIAAIGYFLVGPHLGQDPKKKINIPVIDKLIQPKEDPKPTSPAPSDAPEVDITVRPANSGENNGSR